MKQYSTMLAAFLLACAFLISSCCAVQAQNYLGGGTSGYYWGGPYFSGTTTTSTSQPSYGLPSPPPTSGPIFSNQGSVNGSLALPYARRSEIQYSLTLKASVHARFLFRTDPLNGGPVVPHTGKYLISWGTAGDIEYSGLFGANSAIIDGWNDPTFNQYTHLPMTYHFGVPVTMNYSSQDGTWVAEGDLPGGLEARCSGFGLGESYSLSISAYLAWTAGLTEPP